jgi:hypothetical protein
MEGMSELGLRNGRSYRYETIETKISYAKNP